jgi:hypothetical protein
MAASCKAAALLRDVDWVNLPGGLNKYPEYGFSGAHHSEVTPVEEPCMPNATRRRNSPQRLDKNLALGLRPLTRSTAYCLKGRLTILLVKG